MASARLMPIALTLMRTSFGPGAGTWTSTNSRTSGPPAFANLIERDMAVSGCPKKVIPDNLKTGVTDANYWDPVLNRSYHALGRHYNVAIVPARVRRPRDKATASYCTSFGDWHCDGNEPGWAKRFSAAAPQDGLVGRQLPEATLQLVWVELRDQSLAAPLLDGGFGDAEAGGDLPSGQHAEAAQPLIPAGQLIGGANEGDLLQVEGLRFPSPAAALVEDVGDLAIAVPVEEAIDLRAELGLELADLRNRQRPFEPQAASGAATQADMGSDHLGLDQGHVLDEQAQDPLAVARLDARIVPNRRELFG